MKKIIQRKLIINIILSALGIIAIPLIPIGFVFKQAWISFISIAIVVFDFYGLPFFWINFAFSIRLNRIYNSIEYEHLYSVDDINKYTQIDAKEIQSGIKKLIEKQILKGYLFDGSELTLNQRSKLKKNEFILVCPFCGGKKISYFDDENKYICDYCGSSFKK